MLQFVCFAIMFNLIYLCFVCVFKLYVINLESAETWAITKKWENKLIEDVEMDVWSDTERQDKKRVHTRSGRSGECINKSDRKTTEVVCACSKTTTGTCLRTWNHAEKEKDRGQGGWMLWTVWTGTWKWWGWNERLWMMEDGTVVKSHHWPLQVPQMMGQAEEKED